MLDIELAISALDPLVSSRVFFFISLLYISFLDCRYMLIYNRHTLPLFIIGTAVQFLAGNWYAVLWGLTCGGLLYLAGICFNGGMGGGDVKLAAVIGAWLGDGYSLLAIIIAFWCGGLAAIGIILFKGRNAMKYYIPFAPFLSLGGMVSMIWGSELYSWYASII